MSFLLNQFIWTLSFVIFFLGSAFLHEISHYVAARAVGFAVVGYRLLSIPFIHRGYVDVHIKGRISNLKFKKSLLHASGLLTHLFILTVSIFFVTKTSDQLWRGIWISGCLANIYLLIINWFPEESDGRKLMDLLYFTDDRGR